MKLKVSKVGFALSFSLFCLNLTVKVKLRRSEPLANSGSKGGFWKQTLHAENAELTVLIGALVCSVQASKEGFIWKKISFSMCSLVKLCKKILGLLIDYLQQAESTNSHNVQSPYRAPEVACGMNQPSLFITSPN